MTAIANGVNINIHINNNGVNILFNIYICQRHANKKKTIKTIHVIVSFLFHMIIKNLPQKVQKKKKSKLRFTESSN